MGNLIIYFSTWPLIGGEFIAFAGDTLLQLNNATPALIGVDALMPPFTELTQKAQQAFQASAVNPVTKAKDEADALRGVRYAGYVACVRSAMYDRNPEIVAAAEQQLAIINEIGSPVKLGDSKQTVELERLFARLTPLAAQVERIGATGRLNDLKSAAEAFVQRQIEWFAAGGKKVSGNLTNVRQQWGPIYKSIIFRINSLAEVNGPAAYQAFADAHNATIAHYRNLVAQRTGRRTAAKQAADAATPAQ